MNLKFIFNSFLAFNQNAANHLAYSISTNWWLILLIIAALASIIMGVAEHRSTIVHEEQNIL